MKTWRAERVTGDAAKGKTEMESEIHRELEYGEKGGRRLTKDE